MMKFRPLLTILLLSCPAWAVASAFNPGDLFVAIADPAGGSVLRITPAGAVSTFATGLDRPSGLAFTPNGQLYVVEAGAGEVMNITAGGSFADASPHAFGFGFATLRNLLADDSGRLLVANRSNGTVVDVTAGGSAGSLPLFASGLSGSRDVFQTSMGSIYVVEEFSGEVTDITAGGDFSSATPFAFGFDTPYALAESPDNELFLAEILTGNVFNITGGNVALFASGLSFTNEIIFNTDGSFLAVQEFDGAIVDISGGGLGPFPLFATSLGIFPQQIAIAPAPVPLPGGLWLLLSAFVALGIGTKRQSTGT